MAFQRQILYLSFEEKGWVRGGVGGGGDHDVIRKQEEDEQGISQIGF